MGTRAYDKSMHIAYSVNGVPVRIPSERWEHIVENHDELAGRLEDVILVIEEPDWVTQESRGSLAAWKGYGKSGFLVAYYKELHAKDGFLITAFFTTRSRKGRKIWP